MKNFLKIVKNNEKKMLFGLVIFALILRLSHVYIFYTNNGTQNWSDDWEYLSMGSQIANGDWSPKKEGLPYMQVGPMIPILIALFIKIFGNPYFPFFFYNVLLTSLLVIVLFYLGKDIFNSKVGWLLAIWCVFNTEFYKYNPHLLKEATVYLFLPLTLFFLIKSMKTNSSVKYVFFASLSFTWLIHSDERYFIYFPIFALSFLLIKPFKIKRAILLGSLWVGFVLLLMLPWGIRNYKVFDQVVIISPRTTAFTSKIWGENISTLAFSEGYQMTQERYKQALEFGKEYGITPQEYGKYEKYVRAFINFWQPTYFKATYIQYGFRPQKWSLKHNVAGLLFYGIFLLFYLLGIILLIKKKYPMGIFIGLIPIVQSLIHTYMVWPLERYRSPIVFIIVLIGFWVATNIFDKKTIKD